MVKAAILGYGTVGSGVAEVLSCNQELIAKRAGNPIEVKYILDLRDFPGDPAVPGSLFWLIPRKEMRCLHQYEKLIVPYFSLFSTLSSCRLIISQADVRNPLRYLLLS